MFNFKLQINYLSFNLVAFKSIIIESLSFRKIFIELLIGAATC